MSTQTLIQLKYSTANSAPSSLQVGEPAYSYVSNTLFIGTSDGTGSLKVGGQYYTNMVDNASALAVPSTLVLRNSGGSSKFNDVTANTLNSNTTIYAGLAGASPLGGATNPVIGAGGNVNNYVQAYIRNINAGDSASADLIAYPDNGTDTSGWIDLGITSSTFADPNYAVTSNNEGYLFMSAPSGSGTSGNLVIATDSTGTYNDICFHTGSLTDVNSRLGHFRAGQGLVIDATTGSSGTDSGALVVKGGLGVAQNIRGAAIYDNGNRVVTSVTVTAGTGMSGGGTVNGASGSVTLNNTGVLSLSANSGEVTVSSSTGALEFGLAETAVTAGTYGGTENVPYFVVDAFGRITEAGNNTITTSWTLQDDASSTDVVYGGDTLSVLGSQGITSTITGSNELTVSTDDTVVRSNTSSVGPQSIQTDVTITGNLIVTGTQIYANTTTVQSYDSLIELASNNSTDALDIGFYGQYDSSGTKYAGLIRKAADKFYLIKDVTDNPTSNNVTFNSGNRATLDANITGGTVSGLASAIGIASGGTGSTTFSTHGVVVSGSTSTSALTAVTGSAYQVMQLNSSGEPVFGGIIGGTF